MLPELVRPRFTLEEAISAADDWGANCGPGALAAITGKTLEEIRPHLGDFESKRYTNPTLMFQALRSLGIVFRSGVRQQSGESVQVSPRSHNAGVDWKSAGLLDWPDYGLARVQWEGPWTAPGVPIRVRYRHTHWVACISDPGWPSLVPGSSEPMIFDINCMCVGGWVSLSTWSTSVVPWLLRECEPKANGRWHLTHAISLEVPVAHSGKGEAA